MNKCIPLSDLNLNKKAKILNFVSENIPIKLLEMGMLPDTWVCIVAKAPFNGPYLIEYGKDCSRLSLRKEEAAGILIEQMEE